MTLLREVAVYQKEAAANDAFGRLRVSEPTTVFDCKQLNDNQPLFFDDSEVSGGGTSSSYNSNQASTTISVSNVTAGNRVRQTFQRFNYQPGKSHQVLLTGILGSSQTGIAGKLGYFDDNNGLFFEINSTGFCVVKRTYTSGSAVDTKVYQANFNLDTLDGNGPSGVTIDTTKTLIYTLDMEWLGVGRVRMGVIIEGTTIYCHEFLHSNVETLVYISTPNLPIRYEIDNDGTGAAASLTHICSSVSSEGGTDKKGILRHVDSGSISSLSSGTKYAILGIRLKSTHIDITTLLESISIIGTGTNDKGHWELIFNPTVAGTFTYSGLTNSATEYATGANTNTVTAGTETDGGYFTDVATTLTSPNAKNLGSYIDGTVEELVLCVTPITNNITVQASMTWREL